MPKRSAAGFTPETIRFLKQLEKNNNRDWFNENKARYEEHVLDVALRFIESMQEPLAEFAPHFNAVPKRMGGSLMRVYRDTRFSKNKTPYKTNIGIHFRHEMAKDVHAPGYYLHVEPDEVFLGVGLWRPEPGALQAIRETIAEKPKKWLEVRDDKAFRRFFHLTGTSLKRPPRGFDKAHPQIEDLKRKDFIAARNLTVDDILKPRFRQTVVTSFRSATPFMRFLCKAVGVPF